MAESSHDHSESRAQFKSNSLAKFNSFSTHRPNKYMIKFMETQNKTVSKMMQIDNRKSHENHSLDKIDEKENIKIKATLLPSFSHEKRPNFILEEIEKIQKQQCRQKKPKHDERLFNNLKNTYLNKSFQKKLMAT
jgi:hypothetical protein